MSTDLTTLLAAPEGYRSAAVARFLWQMDEHRRMLTDLTRGMTTAELDWQPAPGMNTVGMLLAHIAYAESHLVQVGIEGKTTSDTRAVIGITEQDEGLPLPPGAPPAAAIVGHDLAWFDGMLERARDHTRRVARDLTDQDLERTVQRPRPNGGKRVFNVGWVFYHLLEHEAGHRGQIGLLRHLYRLQPPRGG